MLGRCSSRCLSTPSIRLECQAGRLESWFLSRSAWMCRTYPLPAGSVGYVARRRNAQAPGRWKPALRISGDWIGWVRSIGMEDRMSDDLNAPLMTSRECIDRQTGGPLGSRRADEKLHERLVQEAAEGPCLRGMPVGLGVVRRPRRLGSGMERRVRDRFPRIGHKRISERRGLRFEDRVASSRR